MEFKPWNLFKSGEPIRPLDIKEPPCKFCKYWSPRAMANAAGDYAGVTLCTNREMAHDFSCYLPREDWIESGNV